MKKHEWLFKIKMRPFDPKRKDDQAFDILYMQCEHCGGQVVWWKAPKGMVAVERPVKDPTYCPQ